MRLCKSSHADMNGLTYRAARRSRLAWRSSSCDFDHVQTAHSPIATEISHCIGNSPRIARRFEDHDRIVLRMRLITSKSTRSSLEGVTVAWKLQKEIILLLAWSPAILLQLAHPLVAQGVADHSSFRTEGWGRTRRLYRTLNAMLELCFGNEREALAVAARINAIHDRVQGQLRETAGMFPAGTSYSAHDPALLAWVHATLLAMNLCVYELFVAPLSAEDKDCYCAEASSIEGHLGIPEGRLPRTFGELQQYMEGKLASGEILVTDAARTLARMIVYPEVPRVAEPALGLMRLITLGVLPSRIRDGYGF